MKFYTNDIDTIYLQIKNEWYVIHNNLIGIKPYWEIITTPMDYQSGHIRAKLDKEPIEIHYSEFKEVHI